MKQRRALLALLPGLLWALLLLAFAFHTYHHPLARFLLQKSKSIAMPT
ncbi:MAG: hypothetical protein AAF514_17545 [Verrucomicrobiota bacterium]